MQKADVGKDGDERMESHPMIPGSIMHYAHAAKCKADFEGYQETEKKYTVAAVRTIANTIGTSTPQFVDYMRLVNTFAITERMWKAQLSFTELVLEAGEHSVIGFWAPDYPKARTLDTLCNATINAALLTREPHKEHFPFHFHYDEVKDDNSDLFKYVRQQQAIVEARRTEMRLPKESSTHLSQLLWCIYMLDFTPADITVVRGKFPQARLVGLTTPTSGNDEDAILAAKARIRMAQQLEQQRREKSRQQQQQQEKKE